MNWTPENLEEYISVSQLQKKNVVRLVSSTIGAGGITVVLYNVYRRFDSRGLPSVVLLVVVTACSLGGVGTQYHLAQRRKRINSAKHSNNNNNNSGR